MKTDVDDVSDIRSSKTTDLLMAFVTSSSRWSQIRLAREYMNRRDLEPSEDRFGVKWLHFASGMRVVDVREPSQSEEDWWNSLRDEIDRRIPGDRSDG